MTKTRIGAAATAAALAFATVASAHVVEMGAVQVIHPWAEPSSANSTRAFPTIANDGERAVTLVGAETPLAERVELVVEGHVVDRIAIPAEDVVALTDEATHLRLVGLAEPLAEGGHFPMTLRFDDGAAIDLEVMVGEQTVAADMMAQGEATLTIAHDAIPSLGWPGMTMAFALMPGASAEGLAVGDAVEFELARGADNIYRIGAIWRAGTAPAAAAGAVRATGTLKGLGGG